MAGILYLACDTRAGRIEREDGFRRAPMLRLPQEYVTCHRALETRFEAAPVVQQDQCDPLIGKDDPTALSQRKKK